MSQAKEKIIEGFFGNRILPELPELRFFSLMLLMFAFCFSGNLQDLSLMYLQYSLVLFPLIHMESLDENEHGKKRFFFGSYFFFFLSYLVSWFWTQYLSLIPSTLSTGVYLTTVLLILLCLYKIFPNLKAFFTDENSTEYHNAVILSVLLLAVLLLSCLKIFKNWAHEFEDQYSVSKGIFSVTLLTIIFLAMEVIAILRMGRVNNISGSEKDENLIMEEAEMVELAAKVESALLEKDLFLQSYLSLADLSKRAGIPSYKLSYLFNHHFQKGFYQILGEYRIRYAMDVMDKNHNISFDVLSEMCGFNSRSTFYKYFKMINSCTPKEYLRSLQKSSAIAGTEK